MEIKLENVRTYKEKRNKTNFVDNQLNRLHYSTATYSM